MHNSAFMPSSLRVQRGLSKLALDLSSGGFNEIMLASVSTVFCWALSISVWYFFWLVEPFETSTARSDRGGRSLYKEFSVLRTFFCEIYTFENQIFGVHGNHAVFFRILNFFRNIFFRWDQTLPLPQCPTCYISICSSGFRGHGKISISWR